jgi:hypothetical protein
MSAGNLAGNARWRRADRSSPRQAESPLPWGGKDKGLSACNHMLRARLPMSQLYRRIDSHYGTGYERSRLFPGGRPSLEFVRTATKP